MINLTSVTPQSGSSAGGMNVRIDGNGFLAGASVLFGGTPATNVAVDGGGTIINCDTPSRSSGSCDVVVINPDGESGTLPSGYSYVDPAPTIAAVSPATGPTAGGTLVTITGTGFLSGANVQFGTMPANNVVVSSDTSITCQAPANNTGGCDVIVTNLDGQSATQPGGFVYSDPVPTITFVGPSTGPTAGGTQVTITGTGFQPWATVQFGTEWANNVVFVSSTTITCQAPANSTGGCDVVITNPDGQSATRPGGYVYMDPIPTIAVVAPSSGPTAGGTMVTITGTAFQPGATVQFGTEWANNVVVVSDSVITCDSPLNSTGASDVIVANPTGQSATKIDGFVYSDPVPTITSVVPPTGPTAGGTMVTITGTAFQPGASVQFGTEWANNVVIVSDTQIICDSPPNSTGGVDVIVTNPTGQSATRPAGFVYQNPIPTIAFVAPLTGPTAGGTMLTITGTEFQPGATVQIGSMPANNVVVVSDTTITCETPPNSTGGCDVIVTNPTGQTATQPGGFVYLDPAPTISAVTPPTGTTLGGTTLTITGTEFQPGAIVQIGSMLADNIVIVSDTTITCDTPAHAPGGCDVIVTNPTGQSATRPGGFVFLDLTPTLASVAPPTGPTAGGTVVTISGTGFQPGATVQIGSMPANNVVVVNDTTITCETPGNMTGGCDVIVTNPTGQTATQPGGFVYLDPAPTITAVTPPTGPTAGGTTVTITGTGFQPGATVQIGSMLANNIVIVNDTTITCDTPANPPGGYDVIVTNPTGQTATQPGGFVYLDPAPTITVVTPPTGPTAGGTMVTITGTGFLQGATVQFGSMLANNVVVVNDTTITCESPANTTGGCDVIVTNPTGQTATRPGGFVYVDPNPVVASIAPTTGPTGGGTLVTITGTGFLVGATVQFGTMWASNVVVNSDTTITCESPANSTGGCDVIVMNPDGRSATRAGGFVYVDPAPTIAFVAPTNGPAAGGTPVTILGSGFLVGATVSFGANPAINVVVSSDTIITCVTPPGQVGPCDVIIFNPNGTSATLSPGFFYN